MNKRESRSTDGRGRGWHGAAGGTGRRHQIQPSFRARRHHRRDYAPISGSPDTKAPQKKKKPPRSIADFKGKVVVIFFGSQCPDVCPTTRRNGPGQTTRRRRTRKNCSHLHSPSIPSATPRRHERLHASLRPAFIALIHTPTMARTRERLQGLLQKVEGQTPTSYSMDQSAASSHDRKAG